MNSFILFSFIASQAKQHKLGFVTYFECITLSRIAVTAFNILAQKPVTLADERRTEFDRPLLMPRKRVSPSLTRLHARTDQYRERLLPMTSCHCFLHLHIIGIDSLQQRCTMCRARNVIHIAGKFVVQCSSLFSFNREALSRSKFIRRPSELTGRDGRRSVCLLRYTFYASLRLPVSGIHRLFQCTVCAAAAAAAAASFLPVCQTRRDGETERRHHL